MAIQMLSKSKSARFIRLADRCQSYSASAHDRMRKEMAIYKGYKYDVADNIAGIPTIASESVKNEVKKGILRLIPAFTNAIPKIKIKPDKSKHTAEDYELTQDLSQWRDAYTKVDNDKERVNKSIYHNLIYGHAVTKAIWDSNFRTPRLISVNPTTFSVDNGATESNLSNASYCVHETYHSGEYVKHFYDYKKTTPNDQQIRVRELWMRRWKAEQLGINVDETDSQIFFAPIIEDQVIFARESPFWWPDFPFATWRNFPQFYTTSSKSSQFFGHGYASLAFPSQKLVDECVSNLVYALRRASIGRVMTRRGTLDLDNFFVGHGINVELDLEDGELLQNAIQQFPADTIPNIFWEMFQLAVQGVADYMPSNSPTFVGETPGQGASGKLAETLQAASFNQLSNNIADLIEFLEHRMMLQISLIQQFAKRIYSPMWRRGLDFKNQFPDAARFLGYNLEIPDTSSLPQTLGGKMELVQILAGLGSVMTLEELLEYTGLDTAGFSSETFQQMISPEQGAMQMPGQGQINFERAASVA